MDKTNSESVAQPPHQNVSVCVCRKCTQTQKRMVSWTIKIEKKKIHMQKKKKIVIIYDDWKKKLQLLLFATP